MTDFETHPVGTDDLVKRLRAGKNGQEIEAADRIEQLEAQATELGNFLASYMAEAFTAGRAVKELTESLTRANAATAAAYEVAARVAERYTDCCQSCAGVGTRLRALATADQQSALDKLIAEAEARVWKKAEQIARDTGTCLMPSGHFLSERCADAILAASKKGGAE